MTNRREFLQIGLAASTLPLAGPAALAATEAVYGSTPTIPLYKVLYDRRFPAGVAFAQRAVARGLVPHAMDGDMTRFWYDDLYHRWREGPAAIAGLTAHGALFCLEQLAWDQRMRVVLRVEHSRAAEQGCVVHRLEGAGGLLPAAIDAIRDPAWAAAMADVVAECPRGRVASQTASALTKQAAMLPSSESLFTWVIAPIARA
jgi:hypothetical protein